MAGVLVPLDLSAIRQRCHRWLHTPQELTIEVASALADDVLALLAEVERLGALETTVWQNPETWMQWCDVRVLERAEAAEAQFTVLRGQIARLQALAKRWAQEAHDIDQDGDFCCALTRRNDAGELFDTLRAADLDAALGQEP